MRERPNILYLMCDQFRFDCIAALGNRDIDTPNIDRLARRGIAMSNAYSTCPVCVPARFTVRTGREPFHTGCYSNEIARPMDGLPADTKARCGPYLADTMRSLGYYTFGVGKFHTEPDPFEDLGYDVQMNTEELWATVEDRRKDAYAEFIRTRHPEYAHIQQLHGERTDMYYIPQTSPFPAELTVEAFAADRAIEQIQRAEDKPYFGFVSFIGPHPPFAPPIPYNYHYNPDDMPPPVPGDIDVDWMDEMIPWMNRVIWADGINDALARSLRARYYGEITYIDHCIGRILDAVEARPGADNTLICFFADHGDHMGDHHAWQKESFFEASCHIPFLLSWPDALPAGVIDDQLVCLTDLFGIATGAAGACDPRDGHPVLDALGAGAAPRKTLFACYGRPGTPLFKLMVREGRWKYIYFANGGGEQLFDVAADPNERTLLNETCPEAIGRLRAYATAYCGRPGLFQALEGGALRAFPYARREVFRVRQFDASSGVVDFTRPRKHEGRQGIDE